MRSRAFTGESEKLWSSGAVKTFRAPFRCSSGSMYFSTTPRSGLNPNALVYTLFIQVTNFQFSESFPAQALTLSEIVVRT